MGHSKTTRLLLGSLVTLALMTSCGGAGRDAGPNEDERGQITFWLVKSASATQTSCTDDPDFTAFYPTAPDFNQNVAYYYIYMVSKDGKLAVSEDCDPSDWNSCQPNANEIFQIDGHVLRMSRSKVIGSAGTCDITATLDITLEDKGAQAEGVDRITFQLDGGDCEAFEAQLKQESSNGFGIRDCVAEVRSHATFSHSRDP